MSDPANNSQHIRDRFEALLGGDIVTPMEDGAPDECHVLIIEDDPIDRHGASRAVMESGVATVLQEAASLAEAEHIVNQTHPTIALLDYMLPDGTGLEFLPMLIAKGADVVFVTGAGSESIAVGALREGAADYIVKDTMGAYLKLLPATITRVLDARQLRRERSELLAKLSRALELLSAFESLVTICACCKMIRNGEQWYPIEHFINERVDTRFSHGLCPQCYEHEIDRLKRP